MDAKDRITEVITHYGLNAKSLSEKMGLDRPQAVYDILSGKTKTITEKMAVKIISAFSDISKSWLISGEGEMLSTGEDAGASKKKLIPFYDDISSIGGYNDTVAEVNTPGGRVAEWIDAGDWFPEATSAIRHYGDSMVEYPSGSILALKRVQDLRLILNGRSYVIETSEFRVTKQLQYHAGNDFIMAYSSNRETYPDGTQIHSPITIPLESVRSIDLVLGCVLKEYSNGAIPIIKR